MPAAVGAERPGELCDIDLPPRAHRHAQAVARLGNERGHLAALHEEELVDDPLPILGGRARRVVVRQGQRRDDDAVGSNLLGAFPDASRELEAGEGAPEHAPRPDLGEVDPGLEQVGGHAHGARLRAGVTEVARVEDQGDVEALGHGGVEGDVDPGMAAQLVDELSRGRRLGVADLEVVGEVIPDRVVVEQHLARGGIEELAGRTDPRAAAIEYQGERVRRVHRGRLGREHVAGAGQGRVAARHLVGVDDVHAQTREALAQDPRQCKLAPDRVAVRAVGRGEHHRPASRVSGDERIDELVHRLANRCLQHPKAPHAW